MAFLMTTDQAYALLMCVQVRIKMIPNPVKLSSMWRKDYGVAIKIVIAIKDFCLDKKQFQSDKCLARLKSGFENYANKAIGTTVK